jgi:UDP-N-acetylglucosamine 2-epimerase (non-hydrolysing)
MIHIFVGTKAQFIKMAPIMRELDRRRIDYNFIDAGQHAETTRELVKDFDLRTPDVSLRGNGRNITSVLQAAKWVAISFGNTLFRKGWLRQQVFCGKGGICLIHGDTLTTLISLAYARRCGLKVAHVEAGLRSFRLLDPFPEEIIRLIAMRYSDILFAPSDWAFQNLRTMGYEAKSVNIEGNTVADSLQYAGLGSGRYEHDASGYVTVTIHRVETIYSRSRLKILVDVLEQIAIDRKVQFILHKPTRNQLTRYDLVSRLEQNPNIDLLPLQPYFSFAGMLARADFVITDGGSIQEECYYIGVPCLVMRSSTERTEGLNENVFLSNFDRARIDHFLDVFPKLGRTQGSNAELPSSRIVDELEIVA